MTKLEEIRRARGLSQYDLADLLNVTQAAVSFWELHPRTKPRRKTQDRLRAIFGVDADELLEEATMSPLTAKGLPKEAPHRV
jgi:transcriptional regulator with XRE-family HTH domain